MGALIWLIAGMICGVGGVLVRFWLSQPIVKEGQALDDEPPLYPPPLPTASLKNRQRRRSKLLASVPPLKPRGLTTDPEPYNEPMDIYLDIPEDGILHPPRDIDGINGE